MRGNWKNRFKEDPRSVALRSFTMGIKAPEYRLTATRILMYLRAEKTNESVNRRIHFRKAILPAGMTSDTIYWRPMLYLWALGLIKKKTQRRYYDGKKFKVIPWGYVISDLGMKMDLYDVIGNTFDIASDNSRDRELGYRKQSQCPSASSVSI